MEPYRYPLHQCPLYRLRSRRKLFELLYTSAPGVAELLARADRYREFTQRKSNGSLRRIADPRPPLKRIQSRLSSLLSRIETPDYVMAPAKGRSHIQNAARHRGANAFRLLDVEDFFPNCSSNKVGWFFREVMKCSPDVAAVLRDLTTWKGALPQGAPTSPWLAYFAYSDMWSEIAAASEAAGVTLTVYADDLTLSGPVVRGALVHDVKTVLRKHGHRFNVAKEAALLNAPALITGVVVKDGLLLVRNAHHRKMRERRKQIGKARSRREREPLERSLAGMRDHAAAVEKANGAHSLGAEHL